MTKIQYGLGLFLSFWVFAQSSFAQYNLPQNSVWAVGGKKGIDFNTSPPTIITTGLTSANEGSASVSNQLGELQFCSNGTNVWNADEQVMPHGTNINGSGLNTASTTQAAVIVPFPNSTHRYFLFSLTPVSNCRLFSNIIDMSLDNGRGDIDTTYHLRRTMLKNGLTEKMTVAKGCNNDVWLLVHANSSATFYAYHITENGLDTNAVVSHAGSLTGAAYNQGVMKVSADGRRIMTNTFAAGGQNLGTEIYDFDPATGVVSNAQLVDVINAYGGTFSQKGRLLYVQEITAPGRVYQYDLDRIGQPDAKTFLGNSGQYCDMKLAPDGKIYVASNINSSGFNSYRYFARINQPDLIGLACQFQDTVTALAFPAATGNNGILTQGLPNDVVVATPTQVYARVAMDSLLCNRLDWEILLNLPSSAQSILWNTGLSEHQIAVSESGQYVARYFNNCVNYRDTFKIVSSTIDQPVISNFEEVLSLNQPYYHVQWLLDGTILSNAAEYSFLQSGEYQVVVENEQGCSASETIFIESGLSTKNGNEVSLTVFPNPAQSDKITVSWSQLGRLSILDLNGKSIVDLQMEALTQDIDISLLQAGTYFVQVQTENQIKRIIKMIKH